MKVEVTGVKQHQLIQKIGEGNVLVKVEACGICMSDVEIVDGLMPEPFVKYPCVPGHEFCGRVVEVGKNVKTLSAGDKVSIECVLYCGECFFCLKNQTHLCIHYEELGFTLPQGGYSDYVVINENKAHKFNDNLSFELAALTEPAAVAGHAISRANITKEDTVVVLGPGTVGLLCVAWAKLQKPLNLVVIGIDRANEEKAKIADITIHDNPQEFLKNLTQGRGADVVVEAAGNEKAVELGITIARRGAKICLVGICGCSSPIPFSSDHFCLNDLSVEGIFSYPSHSFVAALRAIESGELPVSHFISHRFALSHYSQALDILRKKNEPTLKILLLPSSA